MNLRQHKTFSEIEQDIQRYYQDGTVDTVETAMKIAGRALSVAILGIADLGELRPITVARQNVFEWLVARVR